MRLFGSDKAVFDALYYTVRDVLDGENKPEVTAPRQESFYQSMTVQQYKEKAAPVEAKKPLGSYVSRGAAPEKPAIPSRPVLHGAVHDVAPEKNKPFTVTAPARDGRQVTYEITPPAAQEEKKAPAVEAVQEVNILPSTQEEPHQQKLEEKEAPWRMVGEVLRTYIICEDAQQNLWLVDKHAAHERIRFDALKAAVYAPMTQLLLAPLTVALAPEEAAAVLENGAVMTQLGFACEDFGAGTVLVREIPSDIRAEDVAATLEELAQKLILGRIDPEGVRDELYHTMACKSAIKAGMVSDEKELAALVERVQSGEIQYCPHGRPVAVKLTKYEIEKMFKRA